MLTLARFASLIVERYASSTSAGTGSPSEKSSRALRPARDACALISAIKGKNVACPRC
jgi:hypothetical protein